jgi:hypothetical protein
LNILIGQANRLQEGRAGSAAEAPPGIIFQPVDAAAGAGPAVRAILQRDIGDTIGDELAAVWANCAQAGQ